ncbi:MAG: hypothetical protein ABI175_05340, partial [Polyangiales bacterium]
PSIAGLDWEDGIGLGGLGLMGYGSGGGGGGSGIGLGASFSPVLWLRSELKKAMVACGGAGRLVKAVVETTSQEIVDVSPVAVGAPNGEGDAKLRTCVAESVWSLELPGFFTLSHGTYEVTAAAK